MTVRAFHRTWLWRLSLAFAAAVWTLGSVGCAKPVVAAAPEPPPLEVPPVPPRLVGPVVVEEAPPPVAEAPEAVTTRPATRQRSRPQTADGTVARAENGSSEGTRPETPVEPAASAAEPAPLLRTPDTANDAEAVRRVREILHRAQENLAKVNPRGLSRGARTNHETATRFIDQAEGALRTGRLDYAKFLAEKADTLSAGLLKR
jgi:hypothetical protein